MNELIMYKVALPILQRIAFSMIGIFSKRLQRKWFAIKQNQLVVRICTPNFVINHAEYVKIVYVPLEIFNFSYQDFGILSCDTRFSINARSYTSISKNSRIVAHRGIKTQYWLERALTDDEVIRISEAGTRGWSHAYFEVDFVIDTVYGTDSLRFNNVEHIVRIDIIT